MMRIAEEHWPKVMLFILKNTGYFILLLIAIICLLTYIPTLGWSIKLYDWIALYLGDN